MMNGFAPVEMLLVQYAAGNLSPYEALLVAAHLSLKPESRKKVSSYEKVGGDIIREVPPARLQAGCLDKVLARIDASRAAPDADSSTRPCGSLSPDLGIPEPLFALLRSACIDDPHCWSAMTGGVMKMELRVCASEPPRRRLRLMRLAPFQVTPPHAHAGREITLVLEGGFTDCSGHYTRGDIVIVNDARFIHSPEADATGCLSLTLTEAPLRFSHPLTHLLNLFRRV